MKPLLTADVFRSKAIELKPAYQPFLSLIRKGRSVRTESPGRWAPPGTEASEGGTAPMRRHVINLGNVR